ncbi:thiamine phosphate synthase [Tenacibaculum sp. SG-28]|uniref:thiamine phosphate synthase n=1 Tax=Tenacibaculum sp. SG-28 TaxID=754426 RepID=UPI000CF3C149|nr:thiamine phosphate synthase [Tenacibaculum sp. SG-28]PQJ20696.1 hypothetical protein BSU00_10370 [Tenacibaculum sp. SG-28]
MIVLISPEQNVTEEHYILQQLFENGLQYFHLRKPGKNITYYRNYLNKIDSQYHAKIVLHEYHELQKDFGLRGIHIKEYKRKLLQDSLQDYCDAYRAEGCSISSSFHELLDVESATFNFDYYFLSPVFNSITKKGYSGRNFDVRHSAKKIIGVGGIKEANLAETKQLGYAGIGILGAVWNASCPQENFRILTNTWQSLE